MGLYTCKYKGNIQISEQGTTVFVIRKESYVEQGQWTRNSISKEVRLSVRIKHKVSDKYGRHKEMTCPTCQVSIMRESIPLIVTEASTARVFSSGDPVE